MGEKELREMVRRSLQKGHSVSYANKIVTLDELYKLRAENIVVQLELEGDNLRLPIGYLNKRELDENSDTNKVDWQNIEVGIDEQLGLKIPLDVQIPIPTVNGTEIYMNNYYLEFRRPIGFDSKLNNLTLENNGLGTPVDIDGIIIRASFFHDGKMNSSYLFDMKPNSFNGSYDTYDSFLLIGDSFNDPYNNITITPLEILDDGGILINIVFD